MFRKPVYAGHKTDNSFKGEILFIYAFGQDGLDFYAEDEFKYHGGNRGSDGKSKFKFGNILCFYRWAVE